MSGKQEEWDKIEEIYLEMKEQELEQVDMPKLWSRIEEKLDQQQQEPKNNKRYKGTGKKVAFFGTLAAAALVVIVSFSLMRAGNPGEKNSGENMNTWDTADSESDHTLEKETPNQQAINRFANGKGQMAESDTSAGVEDSYKSNGEALETEDEEKRKNKEDNNKGAEMEREGAISLLYIEKEGDFYEFSVNVEKYHLQLVEISVKKKENVLALAYSDFSTSVQERLQDEIADLFSYDFYVDSEGVLYMEREDRYYQVHLEEKGDGSDGE